MAAADMPAVRVALLAAVACGAPREPEGPHVAAITVRGPTHAELVCEGERRVNCHAAIELAITNPRAVAVTVERVRFDPRTGAESLAPPIIANPGTTMITIHAHRARTLRLALRIRDAAGALVAALEPAAVIVTNPARDAALRACRACNGDWSVYGAPASDDPTLDAGETCNCRTTDAGTACHDSDTCQGWCNADGFTVVTTERGVAYGYTSGTCSAFVHQRTCAAPIPHGAAKQPLRVKPSGIEDPGSLCVDPAGDAAYHVQLPGDDGVD